ncbi:SAM-dependent methyltransferase [Micractinium conductrix]|uniref:SAM-dependent methyltransferase n=1 Tax=Micractinium conductrix TaxID=554055 RepID=A0A2P6V5M2_9CHLO|nr:SAM-dependent methyltransferase [Micractinium conductrix]|eukprot:PSC69388.1 SAM-dependent methyltransferase [Micractinium conductrix]
MAARLAAPPAPPSPEGLLDLGLDLVGHIARQLPQTYRLRLAATCRALRGQQRLWFAGGGLTVVLPADAAHAAHALPTPRGCAWQSRIRAAPGPTPELTIPAASLIGFPALQEAHFSAANVRLQHGGLAALSQLQGLTSLTLVDVYPSWLDGLQQLQQLRRVSLAGGWAEAAEAALRLLPALPVLTSLTLQPEAWVPAQSWHHLGSLTALQDLTVRQHRDGAAQYAALAAPLHAVAPRLRSLAVVAGDAAVLQQPLAACVQVARLDICVSLTGRRGDDAAALAVLTALPLLQHLRLETWGLGSEAVPAALGQLDGLTHLEVAGHFFSGSWEALRHLRHLRELSVQDVACWRRLRASLPVLGTVTSLTVGGGGAKLSERIWQELSRATQLRALALHRFAVRPLSAVARSFEHLTRLSIRGERLGGILAGALTSNLIVLGDKLGLYGALKDHGPCTAAALAQATGCHLGERYVVEWLRQQASMHLISTDEAAEQFWLTPAQAECLVNEAGPNASPHYSAGGFEVVPGLAATAANRLPELFKKGGGIGYDQVERGVTCGTCRELGVWVRHHLVPHLRSLPGLAQQLEEGCMVADVGCGCGEAAMAVAAAFPACAVHGYDIAEQALSIARGEAKRRGLTNCEFRSSGLEECCRERGLYQLAITNDAIHDMAHPTEVMHSVRRALAPGGRWVIGDMSALGSHAANVRRHPAAPLLYAFSVQLCLPSGMSAPGGEALGTMGVSADDMCRRLREAGFASAEVLDWPSPTNRYYLGSLDG